MTTHVLAVDLGASSIRVARIDLDQPEPAVEVVHRWHHHPVTATDGSLRWNWAAIVDAVEAGLGQALSDGPVASIGIDGWGVDYGLTTADGRLVSSPYSYRDHRTYGWKEMAAKIGLENLYLTTGIQLMGINTVFQLAAHDPSELEQASQLLLLPDLLVNHLTGYSGAERSNLSTTGMMDVRTGEWARDIVSAIGINQDLLPPPATAGTLAGHWRGTPVHLIGSHDTASAFLGMPSGSEPGTVFVSTGTWVIVGMERDRPDTTSAAFKANFSNEAGALGGIRFLRNVVGFWILEQCRRSWGSPPLSELLREASSAPDDSPTFDAADARFVAPDDMATEIRAATGLPSHTPRGTIVRSALRSIVAGVGDVIEDLARISGTPTRRVALVGGGSRSPLLRRMLENRTGVRVMVGSPEATSLGNALVQGVGLGRFTDLRHAREWVDAAPAL